MTFTTGNYIRVEKRSALFVRTENGLHGMILCMHVLLYNFSPFWRQFHYPFGCKNRGPCRRKTVQQKLIFSLLTLKISYRSKSFPVRGKGDNRSELILECAMVALKLPNLPSLSVRRVTDKSSGLMLSWWNTNVLVGRELQTVQL